MKFRTPLSRATCPECSHQTALDWLKEQNLVPSDAQYGTRYLREELGGTYSVIDVERKRDL